VGLAVKDLEKANVITEIRSLRGFVMLLLAVALLSLGLNAVRTYLVDAQIKKLAKENMTLRTKMEHCNVN
jgi:hypothetical protein